MLEILWEKKQQFLLLVSKRGGRHDLFCCIEAGICTLKLLLANTDRISNENALNIVRKRMNINASHFADRAKIMEMILDRLLFEEEQRKD